MAYNLYIIHLQKAVVTIKLYHGTTDNHGRNIEENGIVLNKSKSLLDFSKGFYTTPELLFALKTANYRYKTSRAFIKLQKSVTGTAIVELEFDERLACSDGLRIKEFETPTVEWARFVVANRADSNTAWLGYDNNRDQAYDIVIGPIADSTLRSSTILEDISSGKMQIADVLPKDFLPATVKQISFHTQKSLACIKVKDVVYYDWKEGFE